MLNRLLVIILALLCVSCSKKQDVATASAEGDSQKIKSANHIQFTGLPVKYTMVAACQMRCNKLKVADVRKTLEEGNRMTKPKWEEKKPCPFYAVERKTEDGNRIVVLVAACDKSVKVARVFTNKKKKCKCTPKEKEHVN